MTTITTILGSRPEIIKLSPLLPLLQAQYRHVVIHTGQHPYALDGVFFEELRLRPPDVRLNNDAAPTHERTAARVRSLVSFLAPLRPDAVVLHSYSSSALAGALAAAQLGLEVIHLEAGCRTFNQAGSLGVSQTIDRATGLHLAPNEAARTLLLDDGVPENDIRVVGSTTVDACRRAVRYANGSTMLHRLKLTSRGYLLCTLHRHENLLPAVLPGIVAALNALAKQIPIVLPLHPRTAAALEQQQLCFAPQILVLEPLGYIDVLQLLRHAQATLTDSTGLQEEAAALNVPLLIVGSETEWMYLVHGQKAVLVGNDPQTLLERLEAALGATSVAQMRASACKPEGGAAQRILMHIDEWIVAKGQHHRPPTAVAPFIGAS